MLTQDQENQIIAMFKKAVANPENHDANEVDGINWNFVDADVNMDVKEAGLDVDPVDLLMFIDDLITEELGEVE
jgi:hypothetical protein